MVDTCLAHNIFKVRAAEKNESTTEVTLTVSRTDDVLAVILNCGNTATMNALTEKSIYSFYPDLTLRNVALMGGRWCGYSSTWMERYSRQGLTASRCTRGFDGPCGYDACPAIARRVVGLRSIGVMMWNREGLEEDDLGETSLAWSMNTMCQNWLCPNYGRKVWDN